MPKKNLKNFPKDTPESSLVVEVRKSKIHGMGVFALTDISRGQIIIEYTGEIISWEEAQNRHPHDPAQPFHTFYFHIDDEHVIDGLHEGNESKWINHSCAPNCKAKEEKNKIFIIAKKKIKKGEELFYDYGLVIDDEITDEIKADYPCYCGAKKCRGTLLTGNIKDE